MKLTFEVIQANLLEDGDIFYCTPDFELNEFGPDYLLTGTDQILIRDDYFDEDNDGNYGIIVNGGHRVWFKPNEKVVRLGDYGDLLRVLEMIKEGNPNMLVGPNDINTLVDNVIRNDDPEDYTNIDFDLLDGM